MRTHLHRDVHSRLTAKAFKKGFRRGHHPFLRYDLSPFVQDADAALFVTQIDSYITAGLPRPLFFLLGPTWAPFLCPSGARGAPHGAGYRLPPQGAPPITPSFWPPQTPRTPSPAL